MRIAVLLLATLLALPAWAGEPDAGVVLERLPWDRAASVLTPETVVVIPMGAAAKEHGPHLPLNADWLQAEYVKTQVLARADVVVAPTINYGYYPAFVDYPGSTTLELDTARDMLVQVCRSLARHGPRRFYVINIGISTLAALKPAADILAKEGIALHYTDLERLLGPWRKTVGSQKEGTHADEVETSMLLVMHPALVDMRKATRDGRRLLERGGLTRDGLGGKGLHSPSGVYGDATLATPAKGRQLVTLLVDGVLGDIESLRKAPLPAPPVARP
jgi:creatinine amidohydrolase